MAVRRQQVNISSYKRYKIVEWELFDLHGKFLASIPSVYLINAWPNTTTAAFLGSCNSILLLASQFLSQDFHDLVFPDEVQATTTFDESSSGLFIPLLPSETCSSIRSNLAWEALFSFFKHTTPSLAHSSLSLTYLVLAVDSSRLSLKSLLLWLFLVLSLWLPCVCDWVFLCFHFSHSACILFPLTNLVINTPMVPWEFIAMMLLFVMLFLRVIQEFWRNNVFLMMIIPTQVMYTTLTFSLAIQLISMCLFIALPCLPTFPSCAGVAAAAGEVAKDLKH